MTVTPKTAVRRLSPAAASLALAAALLAPPPAAAGPPPTPAIGFPVTATGAEDNAADAGTTGFSLGFEFTVNSASLVTSLGYFYDPAFNPTVPTFATPHQVGLYQVVPGVGGAPQTGLLLASAAVASGDPQTGDFLYHSLLLPVALVKGGDYVLAGVSGPTDPYFFDVQDSMGNADLTVNPAITYVQDRSTVSTTLAFPTSPDPLSEPGFFGPNFLLAPTPAVPEASTTASFGLLLLGLGGMALAARKRKTRA